MDYISTIGNVNCAIFITIWRRNNINNKNNNKYTIELLPKYALEMIENFIQVLGYEENEIIEAINIVGGYSNEHIINGYSNYLNY